MSSICFYFQVHQPKRVKDYKIFQSYDDGYFDFSEDNIDNNKGILKKVSERCYLPANALLLKLLKKHPEFKISFSFSGVVLEQFEKFAPEVLESFKDLIKTGQVEILSETYHHSLAFLYSKAEFQNQIDLHKRKIKEIFAVTPKIFRNTELIYSDEIAEQISALGFEGILAEGEKRILKGRSPNFLYHSSSGNLKLFLKNYRLSDDIAFRFSNQSWSEYPLSSEKFCAWLSDHKGKAEIINLFMDYETFGEHQWKESGIFNFLEELPEEVLRGAGINFITPTEASESFQSQGEINAPDFVSWADKERDLSAWRSNDMQHRALEAVYDLEKDVLETEDSRIINDWRDLQTSDHFYYMCTKYFEDGMVHKYFNPFDSPQKAHRSFMMVLDDLKTRIKKS